MGGGASKKALQDAEARAAKSDAEAKKHQAAADELRKANQSMEDQLKKSQAAESQVKKDHSQLEGQLKTEKASKAQLEENKAQLEESRARLEEQMRQDRSKLSQLEDQLKQEKSNHSATQGKHETVSRDFQLLEQKATKDNQEVAALKDQHRAELEKHREQAAAKLQAADAFAKSVQDLESAVEAREAALRIKLEVSEEKHTETAQEQARLETDKVRLELDMRSEYEAAMANATQYREHMDEVAEHNSSLIGELLSASLVRECELKTAEQAAAQQDSLHEAVVLADVQIDSLTQEMRAVSSEMARSLALAEEKHEALMAELDVERCSRLKQDHQKNRQSALIDGRILCAETFRHIAVRDELEEAARANHELEEAARSNQELRAMCQKAESNSEVAMNEKVSLIRSLTTSLQLAEDQQEAAKLELASASAQASVEAPRQLDLEEIRPPLGEPPQAHLPQSNTAATQTDLPVTVTRQAMERLAENLRDAELRQYALEAELSASWADAQMRVYPGAINYGSPSQMVREASANFLWRPKLI